MKEKIFFSGLIGILAMIGTLYCMITVETKYSSFADYIISIIAFLITTIVAYLAMKYIHFQDVIPGWVNKGLIIIVLLFEIRLFWGLLVSDDGYYGADVSIFFWHILPKKYVCFLFVAVSALGIYIYLKTREAKKLDWGIKLYFIGMAFLYACTVVYLNIFAADVYHVDAFLHPIYSVYYNTPYSADAYGIYGHYELLYKIPLMIFGTSPVVICTILFIVAMICALCVDYIICSITNTNLIRIMSAFVLLVPTGVMFQDASYQTTPHRIFFPLMIISYACYINKERDKSDRIRLKDYLLGHLICSFAVLSNTETGMISLIAWTVVCLIWLLQEKNNYIMSSIKYMLVAIIMGAIDITFVLGIVNLYNHIVGGNIYIREFFGTFSNKSFMDHYIIPVQFRNVPYIYIMIAGCAALIFAFSKTKVFAKVSDDRNSSIVGMVGVMTIGILSYYVIRAAYYGLLIVVPFAVILCAFFADSFSATLNYAKVKQGLNLYLVCRIGVGTFCISVLCILSVMGSTYLSNFTSAYEQGKYSISQLKKQAEIIAEEVPENTYAFGWGTDELYGFLGWDTGYHLFGTTDVLLDPEANQEVYKQLVDEANSQDAVFVNRLNYQDRNILSDEYDLVKEITYQGKLYGYFVKDEYNNMEKIDVKDAKNIFVSNIECEISLQTMGYRSLLLSSEEIDLKNCKVLIQSMQKGDTYLIDSNEVEEIAGISHACKIYARVNDEEFSSENDSFQVLIWDSDNEVIYSFDKTL